MAARASHSLRVASAERRGETAPSRRDGGGLDLRRDLGQVGEGMTRRPWAATILPRVRSPLNATVAKFFADRGTHLAAMIAYFALLSFVPLIFLALSLLGFAGRADESSYLVKELRSVFPAKSVTDIVERSSQAIQQQRRRHSASIGGVVPALASLSLFSVLESAFNIVYGLPNRSFLRGKVLATLFMAGSLVILFVALLVGSLGYDLLQRYAPGVVGNGVVAYVLSPSVVSTLGVFVFLVPLRPADERRPDARARCWPGAVFAAVLLQATLPGAAALRPPLARGAVAAGVRRPPSLLLVWLYVMANVIVFGAEVNWWCAPAPADGGRGIGPGLA